MDSFQTTETIILRDYLAIERTRMANERTLLSFLRTGLYLIMTGFSMLELEALGGRERLAPHRVETVLTY